MMPSMFRRFRSILIPWLALRIFLSVVAIAGTSNRREPGTIQHAPHRLISDSWSDSAQQILLEPWRRWDVDFYVKIADCGYKKGDGTAQFHPLHPWIGRVIGKLLGGNMLAGLWIASNVFGLLFLFVLRRLAELDLSAEMSNRAAILFL